MSEFTIDAHEHDKIRILSLKGYLDAHTAPQLETSFQKELESGHYKLVINFRDLNYISSAGLGVFMQFIEEVRKHEGDIKLANMSKRVYNVFDLLGFPVLFEIFEDEKEALLSFQNKS